MGIKLNSVNIDRKKPIRINTQIKKITVVSEQINFDDLRKLDDNRLISELKTKADESFLGKLYSEAPDLIDRYIYSVWNNRIREMIKVVNYNKLQEFYLSKMNAEAILSDPILSYSILSSNYMKEYLDKKFDYLEGLIITRDLPDKSYDILLEESAFTIYNAE